MKTRRLYPVFLDLSGRPCLVIGGGAVAERKTRRLLACGAYVMVVSPSVSLRLKRLCSARRISLKKRRFVIGDLDGASLVICATNDKALNKRVAELARKRGVLINVADSPDLCDFHLPAVIRRGLLQIAVSTTGSSPALARRIRIDIARKYGSAYARFLNKAARERKKIIGTVAKKKRAAVLRSALDYFPNSHAV